MLWGHKAFSFHLSHSILIWILGEIESADFGFWGFCAVTCHAKHSGFSLKFAVNLKQKQFEISCISWAHQQWCLKIIFPTILWQFSLPLYNCESLKSDFYHSNISAMLLPICFKLRNIFIFILNKHILDSDEKMSKFWFIWPFNIVYFFNLLEVTVMYLTIISLLHVT